jgi:hypothetical protein
MSPAGGGGAAAGDAVAVVGDAAATDGAAGSGAALLSGAGLPGTGETTPASSPGGVGLGLGVVGPFDAPQATATAASPARSPETTPFASTRLFMAATIHLFAVR